MFERFTKQARQTVRRAAEIAEQEGAATVEVEHLLTAVVDPAGDDVGLRLVALGITPARVRDARDREFQSALALAGVHTDRSAPAPMRRQMRGRTTTFAPSSKLALERTLEVALASGDRRISNKNLLIAITHTNVGVIPRLLRELDTTPDELREAANTS